MVYLTVRIGFRYYIGRENIKRVVFTVLPLLFFFVIPAVAQESLTITTYYPAPIGRYREVRSGRIAIGPTYHNPGAHPWSNSNPPLAQEISQDADFIVERAVGVGTYQPLRLFHVDQARSTASHISLFDNSDALIGPWTNRIGYAYNGTLAASLDVSGVTTNNNPVLSQFAIDLAGTTGTDFVVDPSGNAGLRTPTRQAPGNSNSGSLAVNDVFIRKTYQWLSQMTGSSTVYHMHIADHSVAGNPAKVNNPVFLYFELPLPGVDPSTVDPSQPFTWQNTPFASKPYAIFGRQSWSDETVPQWAIWRNLLAEPVDSSTMSRSTSGYYLIIGEGK